MFRATFDALSESCMQAAPKLEGKIAALEWVLETDERRADPGFR
jgi:hypothetical protein